ncbi:hypothetical protein [Arthrobacter sp. H35-D1]|nr:hypothetical protein [Arthrobacter sp. H35-D1]MDJ0314136.1 hypothetical protein [Arthrobacter sp. H35-D1]
MANDPQELLNDGGHPQELPDGWPGWAGELMRLDLFAGLGVLISA